MVLDPRDPKLIKEEAAGKIAELLVLSTLTTVNRLAARLCIIALFEHHWPELRQAAHQLHAAIEAERPKLTDPGCTHTVTPTGPREIHEPEYSESRDGPPCTFEVGKVYSTRDGRSVTITSTSPPRGHISGSGSFVYGWDERGRWSDIPSGMDLTGLQRSIRSRRPCRRIARVGQKADGAHSAITRSPRKWSRAGAGWPTASIRMTLRSRPSYCASTGSTWPRPRPPAASSASPRETEKAGITLRNCATNR
jgi:hypothetical protein